MNRHLIARFILFQYIKSVCIIVFSVDPSLSIVHSFGVTPYSLAWEIFNPFNWTQWEYKIWLLCADSYWSLIYLRNFGIRTNIAYQLTSIHWFTGFFQNITVTMFAPLQFKFGKRLFAISSLGIIPLLQKLPLDPINFENRLNCALACGQRYSYSALTTYSLIIAWTVFPLLYRTILWRRSK